MNEKVIGRSYLGIIGICLFVFTIVAGCKSAGNSSTTPDAVDIGAKGARAIGQLERIYTELERISERERREFDRIQGTVGNLAGTIQSLVNFVEELLDEIDRLRAEIEHFKGAEQESMDTGTDIVGA